MWARPPPIKTGSISFSQQQSDSEASQSREAEESSAESSEESHGEKSNAEATSAGPEEDRSQGEKHIGGRLKPSDKEVDKEKQADSAESHSGSGVEESKSEKRGELTLHQGENQMNHDKESDAKDINRVKQEEAGSPKEESTQENNPQHTPDDEKPKMSHDDHEPASHTDNSSQSEPEIQTQHDLSGGESPEARFDSLIDRMRLLLKASKGKEIIGQLANILELHEKTAEAQKQLKEEVEKTESQDGSAKEESKPNLDVQQDLLLSQQLSNMWALPFYEDEKRAVCLSGFEKLTHEATIECSDSECFKLETQSDQCPYMSIVSIMRKEDLDRVKGLPEAAEKHSAHGTKDHMLLGFDGECKNSENLGKEILNMLQRPKSLAEKRTLEQFNGTGGTVPLQQHHLDLICDTEDKAEYPACKTVFEALQHFKTPEPRALPELLVLTDIRDLKNTLGLYRISFLFEGLVQFTSPDGSKIDASKHKLPLKEAKFVYEHRHQNIASTVMLKGD
ncbi:hypothetical protein cyc_06763 [Cyclospora cayetanensis]|nr:hypothetical protein cyc_06763 [Cyclospora cayetanensis]